MINALGIDIEEWYHISGLNLPVDLSKEHESRVAENTEKILDILGAMHSSATFFILGSIAEQFPGLVEKIDKAGHEIATHGYRHLEIYKHTKNSFRDDVRRSMAILQDITKKPVKGYRAPNFSITKNSLWALDILVEEGIQYDCSIFPIRHPRYGIPSAPRLHYRVRKDLIEFPPSAVGFPGGNFPIAGGAYFRILPYFFTKKAIERLNSRDIAVNFYLHAWEMDPKQPRLKIPFTRSLTHYYNLKKTKEKFEDLLGEFKFAPICKVIEDGRF